MRISKLLVRWLVALAAVALAAVLGAAWLFTGSEVVCTEEVGDDGGPRLVCAFEVAAPPATVWRALTVTGEPRPFYFDAVLQAEMRPGGRWRFVTDDLERLLAHGEVLELLPSRRLAQTFVAADLDDPPSRLSMELEETSAGSRVRLVHDRFGGRTTTFRRFRRAHPLALSALASWLETGELPVRARIYTLVFKPGMKTFTIRAQPWE